MRIAVISFAHVHAESYLTQLAARADVEVIGCDPGGEGPERGRSLSARLGVGYVDTLAEVETWAPDAIVIASENVDHRRHALWAAEHRWHVLCEKPLATTLDDGIAIVEACNSAGVRLMIAHPVRFSPAFTELCAAASRGEIGALLAAQGSNNGKSPVGSRSWFGDPVLAGGGAIMDHTVHLADLFDALLGGVHAAQVQAEANNILFEDELTVESAGIVSIRYEDGFVATVECGWTHPSNHPTWGGLDLTLVGAEGVIEFDGFPPLAQGYAASGPVVVAGGPDLDAAMLDEFIGALLDGREPQPNGAAGLRTLEIVDAAYRSWRSGEVAPVRTAVVAEFRADRTHLSPHPTTDRK